MKFSFLLLLLLLHPNVFIAQESTENWIETEAIIIEVHNKHRAKSTRAFAKVSFTANDSKQYESQVEVLALPIYGTTKSVGDSVTIKYNPKTPMIAKSIMTNFIESYGLYFLIGAGIILSFRSLKKVYGTKSE